MVILLSFVSFKWNWFYNKFMQFIPILNETAFVYSSNEYTNSIYSFPSTRDMAFFAANLLSYDIWTEVNSIPNVITAYVLFWSMKLCGDLYFVAVILGARITSSIRHFFRFMLQLFFSIFHALTDRKRLIRKKDTAGIQLNFFARSQIYKIQ